MDIAEAKERMKNAATAKDRVLAERGLGCILLEMEKQNAFLGRGKRRNGAKPSLLDFGITSVQAYRCKALGSIPDTTFNDLLERASARQRGPATAGIIDLANDAHRPALPILGYINSFIFKAPQRETRHGNAR